MHQSCTPPPNNPPVLTPPSPFQRESQMSDAYGGQFALILGGAPLYIFSTKKVGCGIPFFSVGSNFPINIDTTLHRS